MLISSSNYWLSLSIIYKNVKTTMHIIIEQLVQAIREKNVSVALRIIDALEEKDLQDIISPTNSSLGGSFLHLAAENNLPEVIEELLKKNIIIDSKAGVLETTPLYIACDKGYDALVEMLLKCQAGVDVRNKLGMTALHVAASLGYIYIVNSLLKAGADPNIQDNMKWSALHYAAYAGNVKAVEALLDGRAYIHIQNEIGQTPLHIAVINKRLVLETLLERGAEADFKDFLGRTPLDEAKKFDNKSIYEILYNSIIGPESNTADMLSDEHSSGNIIDMLGNQSSESLER